MLQNYSADPKFEEFFRLLRCNSCFYFMIAVFEFDTDNYHEFYNDIVDIDMLSNSD